MCKKLAIKFISSHTEQLSVARGFERKSSAGFNCCVGIVDGILVWLSKPTETEYKKVGVGSAKFFCGRKKFGLVGIVFLFGAFSESGVQNSRPTVGPLDDACKFFVSDVVEKIYKLVILVDSGMLTPR